MTTEELRKELGQMADEFCQENHVGKAKESAAYEDLEAKLREVRQMMDEQRAESQPRQMMDVEDVMAALGVSKSYSYQVIRRLNQELNEAGYITVRGKVSRAFFEKRTYGVDVDAR